MLLGVHERLGDKLVREGHRLRIYVPYGRQWYEYSLRRLQENPAMAGDPREADHRPLRPWPERRVIWAEAEGCRVVDGDGRRLLDLSGGFGVAALGHRNPEVWAAVEVQAARCVHALGDLAEADVTAELRRRLGLGGHEVKLGVTGEDAVEIAPDRAPRHGPSRDRGLRGRLPRHRAPRARGDRVRALPRAFGPGSPGRCIAFRTARIPARCRPDAGCVIVEPVQGRAGARVPPAGFLERLRERCDEAGALLIADEVYCGLGRTGTSGRATAWPTCS